MSALAISLIAFACIFGGTVLGMILRGVLPVHHMSDESKDAVKLGIGMIATMTALVLALLIASAKGNFDTMSSGLRQNGSRVILLDRSWPNMDLRRKKPANCFVAASHPRSSGYGRKTISGKRLLSHLRGGSLSKRSRTNSANYPHGTTPSAGFSPGHCRSAVTLPKGDGSL